MGLSDELRKWLESLANYKKADAEQSRAKTDKDKMKNLRKQNRELKKALSRNQTIGIIGIVIAIAGIAFGIFFAYYPVHH